MIFVSSACSSQKKIAKAVRELAEAGFCNIELTGGSDYYESIENDLKILQKKYNLQYLVHNYFPPPKKDFVLNLASLDDDIFQASFRHASAAIELSYRLGGQKVGFHAGFFLNLKPQDLGKTISENALFDQEKSILRFCDAFSILQSEASQYSIQLYVENNVFSYSNFQKFSNRNPFMLTDYSSYLDLKARSDFNLLLDVAHLKVSCQSLGRDFDKDLSRLIDQSDYIHLSGNDGLHDQNHGFREHREFFDSLKNFNFRGKTLTLEIYNKPVELLRKEYSLLENLLL